MLIVNNTCNLCFDMTVHLAAHLQDRSVAAGGKIRIHRARSVPEKQQSGPKSHRLLNLGT